MFYHTDVPYMWHNDHENGVPVPLAQLFFRLPAAYRIIQEGQTAHHEILGPWVPYCSLNLKHILKVKYVR
jgi:hypothetical protein